MELKTFKRHNNEYILCIYSSFPGIAQDNFVIVGNNNDLYQLDLTNNKLLQLTPKRRTVYWVNFNPIDMKLYTANDIMTIQSVKLDGTNSETIGKTRKLVYTFTNNNEW